MNVFLYNKCVKSCLGVIGKECRATKGLRRNVDGMGVKIYLFEEEKYERQVFYYTHSTQRGRSISGATIYTVLGILLLLVYPYLLNVYVEVYDEIVGEFSSLLCKCCYSGIGRMWYNYV